jgi:hypothetical protein
MAKRENDMMEPFNYENLGRFIAEYGKNAPDVTICFRIMLEK